MKIEHARMYNRLQTVQDHKYVVGLRAEISKTTEIISKLTSESLSLKSGQFTNERKIDQIINRGQNDAMRDIQAKMNELTVVQERIRLMDQQIGEFSSSLCFYNVDLVGWNG